ncbi:MAG: ATP-binding protein [Chlorobium sp.]|uniref:ATP-binding protein n=1 Tax=Chlorobium sp. TaxID=1095 RepID=UPI0025C43A99|nr:ATP-binding protein [Chlorobium sp.]MCF8382838.1 ATP-binding protein [Chlorobium sp.]
MKNHTVVLKSRGEEFAALQQALVLFGFEAGYSAGFISTLELTFKEAFLNAVMHGNHENESLPVTVSLNAESGGNLLEVTFRDCGPGFQPDDLPDPTTPDRLHITSGRGVHLIRSYAEIADARADASGFSLTLRYVPC